MQTQKRRKKRSTGARTHAARGKNVGIYSDFAGVYDLMGADTHSLKMAEYTQRVFRRHRFRGTHGLDLCCGTGSAALSLAELGYVVTGVDGSPYMLKQARRKRQTAPTQEKRRLSFDLAVMPEFRKCASLQIDEQFDFVVSFYDSLNYLLQESDLARVFCHVSRLLNPGGLFVFDMNTDRALRDIWGAQVYAGFNEDMAWIWKNQYYPRTKTADARTVFFVRKGDTETWRRFEEIHTERAYSIATIKKLMRKGGLDTVGVYRCFTFVKAKDSDNRLCIVARKK